MITLEEVLSPENMQTACRRVIANKGAPGVDGMTVSEVRAHFDKHGASICAHIREGRYIPAAVKRVDIPKPNGGTRMLGIPTVQDRVIQQAIAQVLSKHFDPLFSEFSCINRLAVARESPSTERLRFFSFLASCCHPFWLLFTAHSHRNLLKITPPHIASRRVLI